MYFEKKRVDFLNLPAFNFYRNKSGKALDIAAFALFLNNTCIIVSNPFSTKILLLIFCLISSSLHCSFSLKSQIVAFFAFSSVQKLRGVHVSSHSLYLPGYALFSAAYTLSPKRVHSIPFSL